MTAICVEALEKTYKNGVQALKGLSLSVQTGEVFTLLGENGAGKSTLINILTTYLRPTSGNARMLGKDLYKNAAEIRSEIACVAQRTSIDTHLSLTENMMFQSKLYKIPKAEATERMKALIVAFGLERYMKYPVSSYSGGVKRRLDIALNMMSNPKILFMDEPTVGMDIQSRLAMWNMMKKIRSDFGTTIFLTTHYLEEADQLSDSICIMKDGKEIIQGTPLALREYLRQDMLQISFATKGQAKEHTAILAQSLNIKKMEVRESQIVFNVDNGLMELERTNHFLLDNQIIFTGIGIVKPTLEDVFIRLTSNPAKEVG
ncbi:ABC-2 type transport system ATP-binding protein [Aequitasia blattaphilus]|uniref:ABC transporter ATP-binding protein n=1 Tax=Aequitasia blattaphilus TaxID=2949332 RepID=A0ABT1E4Y1_9FIRM|nr:ABC transporter ATP-binding protein [Aequitasia blattaphilus]MCP1100803.1 ABC transporter ATP-binding protein [Aequitasia blattaphilus]MCR8613443.1 ABC transporter ATP-binding protein [Aequitasia blattaphilus]